ncbi:MAG: alginate export family protein [Elainellaceae cyanobacterium]
MNGFPIRYYWLFTCLATATAAALGCTSKGLAQTTPSIQPLANIEPLPISTAAADLTLDTSISFSAVDLPALAATPPEILAQSADSTDTPSPPAPATSDPSADSGYDPNANIRIPPNLAEGTPIERIYVHLRNPTGDVDQDEVLQQEIADAFGLQAGSTFSPLFGDRGINQVRQLPFVQAAEYRVYESDLPGTVIVAVLVTLQTEEAPPPEPGGLIPTGDISEFPVLYESDRALIRLILNGGFGVFSDTNPWFGSSEDFVVGEYQPQGTITWPEFYLEPGLSGITQLGTAPLYIYGAATYTVSGTLAPDVFRDDTRTYGDVEQLYGGVLVAAPDGPVSFNLSGGRQKFQLNQGFLFSQFSGSANALDRAASYSNPRTAYETTVLGNLRFGDFRLQGFFLQPDELPVADSETQYLGASLSYNNNRNLEAAFSYVAIPQSSRLYVLPNGETVSREGLQVVNPRIRLSSLFGVDGLWAEGEYAYQFSNDIDMSAQGGYLWLGYTAQDVSWRPSISYRFAGFSGDDPDTSNYERFDPLQAGGLSDWLQGLSLGKVYNNSNGFSHRVSFSAQPSSSLSLSLDYYYRFADQLNNLGGNRALPVLESRDIGHEVQLVGRYFITQNFMLQGISAIAFPGSAIRRAVSEDTDPWVTLQLSLFMFF